MFLAMFRDLLDGNIDMPDQRMRRADYTSAADEGNEVKKAREQALRRNKRNVAWFSAVTSGAELVTMSFLFDEATKKQINELATSLNTSVHANEDTTDGMVSMGDTICHLVIRALEQLKSAESPERGAA